MPYLVGSFAIWLALGLGSLVGKTSTAAGAAGGPGTAAGRGGWAGGGLHQHQLWHEQDKYDSGVASMPVALALALLLSTLTCSQLQWQLQKALLLLVLL